MIDEKTKVGGNVRSYGLGKKPKGHWHKSNEEETFSGRITTFTFTSICMLEKPKSVNRFPWWTTPSLSIHAWRQLVIVLLPMEVHFYHITFLIKWIKRVGMMYKRWVCKCSLFSAAMNPATWNILVIKLPSYKLTSKHMHFTEFIWELCDYEKGPNVTTKFNYSLWSMDSYKRHPCLCGHSCHKQPLPRRI